MKFRAVFLAAISATALAACATRSPLAMQTEQSPWEALMNQREVGLEQCSSVTGSRIHRPSETGCQWSSYPLRSYSKEQLESTGYIGIGDQLRQVDLAFSQ